MQALRATSEELRRSSLAQVDLAPYAGPQCYPQRKERFMANALEEGQLRRRSGLGSAAAGRRHAEANELDAVAEQFEGCWLRCDDCGARRLVERASLAALRTEGFQKVQEGSDQGF